MQSREFICCRMKLIHVSDLHLGRSLGDFSLIEDQKFILDQILDAAGKYAVDAVLIAGDVYDRAVPSEEAVRLFDFFITRLAEMGIKTFVISGNHDSDERLSFGSSLFQAKGLYICARYDGTLYRQEMEDAYGRINLYLLPFVKASQVKHFFPEEELDSYDKAVRTVIRHAGIDKQARNVLAAHQFVAGRGEDPVPGGSESLAVLNVGAVERIGADCFDDFDYVALGHIHSPQRVGREEVRYAGSPLKYSLSEAGCEKSFPIVTLGEKGQVSVELVKLLPRRDLRHLKGRLEQLIRKEHLVSTEDYIYATLTDEEPVSDAVGILRQYYPNTVRIDYDNSHTGQGSREEWETGPSTRELSFEELLGTFYRLMYGVEISEEEMEVLRKAAGEAGVAGETD